ncbi:MAG: DUF3108 domain-containing protein [Burkholderiales bacterium]
MRRSERLIALAATLSLAAHLALMAVWPTAATDDDDSEPLAVELRSETPPPAALPPRRLPPKPRVAKPAVAPAAAQPQAAEPVANDSPVTASEAPSADTGSPAPPGNGAATAAETPPPEPPPEQAPVVAEEAPPEEPPALLASAGLARTADLRFNVLRGEGKVGEVVWRWRKEGDRYRIETIGTASGIAAMFFGGEYKQTSEGRIGPEGLKPDRYTFERGSADKLDVIRFDWSAGKALVNTAKGVSREFDLVPGTQDLMSFLHQLPLLPADAISIPLVTIKRQRDYSFSAPQTVKIKVPAGEMEAYYYQRIGAETEAEVWLQHQPPYLPIRMRLYDRLGNKFEQVLTELRFEP